MSVIHENSPEQQSSSFWQGMTSRTAFVFGLIVAVAASSIIALIFILSGFSRSSGSAAFAAAPFPVAVAPSPSAPTPSARQPLAAAAGTVKPVDFKTDHIRGSKDAKVFVIEYSDFECPFCKRHHPTMLNLVDQYKGKVAWVYRHFPLSFHQNAQKEAEASECAADQGGNDAFWKYTDKIFERTTSNGTGFALDQLVPLAKEIGLNEAKFKSCLDGGKFAAHVQQDETEGQAAGVTGTPGNIILTKDGKFQVISGAVPLQAFTAAIDPLLK